MKKKKRKKKILFAEVRNFKELKQQIITLKAHKSKKSESKPLDETKSQIKETLKTHFDSTSDTMYQSALEDIKKFIKAEFDKLRKELNIRSS